MSVITPVLRQLLTHPTRIFIVDDQRSWRGFELLLGAMHVASEIERRTDARHVGFILPTSGLFPMAAIGAWMLGKTVIPFNYLLKGDDLQYVIDHSEVDTIVTVGPMLNHLRQTNGNIPAVRQYLRLDEMNFIRIPDFRWPKAVNEERDLAVILYTSGTSGRPKGVMLSHANVRTNVRQATAWARFSAADSAVGVLPQFHVFGLVVLTLLPLTIGCKVIFTARFMPKRIIELIRHHRPTVMFAIPSMYNAFLAVKDSDADDFRSLRYVVSGAEPLPDAVTTGFRERFGVQINEGYGMTETSCVTHWCRPEEHRDHSVGKTLPWMTTRIVSPDEVDLPPGRDGEIRVGGPNIMQGYYKRPEETAAAFDEQGFLRTGDIGRIDDDGFLYITGRLKEMMIIGGENVFPREIEEVINKHPSVGASAVVGARDPSRGEVPVAFVEMKEGHAFNETSLRSHCRSFLAQYKVPREIILVEKLPRTPTGKILRRLLKEQVPSDV